MILIVRHLNICTANSPSKIILFLLLSLSIITSIHAANGPSVRQLSESLDSTWSTFIKVTNCDLPPPQDSLCIKVHHGKTITVKLFGESVNALILFETSTTPDISGPVVTQQIGFLIGPLSGYGYKVIHEKNSYGPQNNRTISDSGLRVSAHSTAGNNINIQGIALNKGKRWLDGKNGPWIYHWSALAKAREALKELQQHMKKNY